MRKFKYLKLFLSISLLTLTAISAVFGVYCHFNNIKSQQGEEVINEGTASETETSVKVGQDNYSIIVLSDGIYDYKGNKLEEGSKRFWTVDFEYDEDTCWKTSTYFNVYFGSTYSNKYVSGTCEYQGDYLSIVQTNCDIYNFYGSASNTIISFGNYQYPSLYDINEGYDGSGFYEDSDGGSVIVYGSFTNCSMFGGSSVKTKNEDHKDMNNSLYFKSGSSWSGSKTTYSSDYNYSLYGFSTVNIESGASISNTPLIYTITMNITGGNLSGNLGVIGGGSIAGCTGSGGFTLSYGTLNVTSGSLGTIMVTGGTLNAKGGTIAFISNTGGTINISGAPTIQDIDSYNVYNISNFTGILRGISNNLGNTTNPTVVAKYTGTFSPSSLSAEYDDEVIKYADGSIYVWKREVSSISLTLTQKQTYYFNSTITWSDFLANNTITGTVTYSCGDTAAISTSQLSLTSYNISQTSTGKVNTLSIKYTGDGDYDNGSASYTLYFTTSTLPLSNCSVANVSNYTYSGSAYTPTPTVSYGGSTIDSSNFTYSYSNNTNAGQAVVTIKPKSSTGLFSGSVDKSFTIYPLSLSAATAASVTPSTTSYVYDGTARTPSVTVTKNSKTLTNNTDYTVAYSNNTNVGTATITVSGKGNYSGTVTKTFAITALSISSGSIKLGTTSYVYDGNAKTPSVEFSLKVGSATNVLVNGTDYSLAYSNNTNAGTATVTLTGKGNFTGTKTANFTISKANPTEEMVGNIFTNGNKLSGAYVGDVLSKFTSQLYTGTYGSWSFVTPSQSVGVYTVGTANAEIGNSFSVKWTPNSTYSNNYNSITSTGYVSVDRNTLSITINESSMVYNGSAAKFSITLKNTTSSAAVPSASNINYKYLNSLGNEVSSIVNAGTYTVTASFAANDTYYSCSKSVTFVVNSKEINSSDVSIDTITNRTYTGSLIDINPTIKYNGMTLGTSDYTYTTTNNINAGTATITITGQGNYSGSRTTTFVIDKMSLNTSMVQSVEELYYTGEILKPTIVLQYNGSQLSVGKDYTVKYTAIDVTDNAVAVVTATDSSNYTGSINVTYRILKNSLPTDLLLPLNSSYTTKVYSTLESITLPSDETKGHWEFDNPSQVMATSGSYDLNVTYYPCDANYDSYTQTVRVNVTKYDVIISIASDNQSKVYDGLAVSSLVDVLSFENLIAEEEIQYTINYYDSNGNYIENPTNVGTYTVYIVIKETNAYTKQQEELEFNITPRSITEISVDDIGEYEFNLLEITPEITASYNGFDLVSNVDYTLGYDMNVYLNSEDYTPTVIIYGKGNFTGVLRKTFVIYAKTITDDMVSDIDVQEYSGFEIIPLFDLYNGSYKMTPNIDYEYDIVDNINVGTATITITGIRYYTGVVVTTFEIDKMNLSLSMIPAIEDVTILSGEDLRGVYLGANEYGTWEFVNLEDAVRVYTYNEDGIELDIVFTPQNPLYKEYYSTAIINVNKILGHVTIKSDSLDKIYDGYPVVDIEYEATGEVSIVYYNKGVALDSKPINAGVYQAVLTSAQNEEYAEATATMWFTISPKKIDESMVSTPGTYLYRGYSIQPDIIVTDVDYTLVKDVDYVINYKNNINVGTATIVIVGMGEYDEGNYSGVYEVDFEISSDSFDVLDETTGEYVTIEKIEFDPVYYTGEAICPEIDLSSYGFELGKDYTLSYADNVNVGVATIEIYFIGATQMTEQFIQFTIVPVPIKNTSIYMDGAFEYTGEAIEPDVTVVFNSTSLVAGTDYKVQYSYNVNIGTGVATITGMGNFTGNFVKTFVITDDMSTYVNSIITLNQYANATTFAELDGETVKTVTHTSYDGNDSYIVNIPDGITLDVLLGIFDNDVNYIRIYNASGEIIDNSIYSETIVATGMKLQIVVNGVVTDSAYLGVRGDTNGDGQVNFRDGIVSEDTGLIYVLTAEVNGNGKIQGVDYDTIKNSSDLNLDYGYTFA